MPRLFQLQELQELQELEELEELPEVKGSQMPIVSLYINRATGFSETRKAATPSPCNSCK
ncbi:hypothetical protein [uncultured Bacteroides sp.]|uniref:hypothetical protein n=1 Tax=uncultured Bacteroides sp. TaxID=162156 RepID=UPI0025F1B155|nr:hypothetical protein [uncultured Bacteroides sp.]